MAICPRYISPQENGSKIIIFYEWKSDLLKETDCSPD